MSKSIDRVCDYCGTDYVASRSTSKFCSDRCRVQNHRLKDFTIVQSQNKIWDGLNVIVGAMESKKFSYEAVSALLSIQNALKFYIPSMSWWHCEKCKTSVHKKYPEITDCKCGEKSQWFMLKTSTNKQNESE